MSNIEVRQAHSSDRNEIAKMCALLWPDASIEELQHELDRSLATGMSGTLPSAIFVSRERDDRNNALTGFVEVGLRSHADGCDPAHPVGYVEGWFVYEPFRRQGIGKRLMHAAEDWARHHGCVEMASDTWIDHIISQAAHQASGFVEVDRCIHFRKRL